MTDQLVGVFADRFELVAKGVNDGGTGRPIYNVQLKTGATAPNRGGNTLALSELAVSRTGADGGQTLLALSIPIAFAPLTLANQALSIAENPAAGAQIGTITATGGTGTKVYSIGAGSSGAIVVSPTGLVAVAGSVFGGLAVPNLFDFEQTTSFTEPIQVADDTGTTTATLTVAISNVNESPSALSISISIEDTTTAIGTVVTALPAITDPDIGETHTTEIYTGNTSNDFQVSNNNLICSTPLQASRTSSYTLTMRVADSGGAFGFYTISIAVTQGNAPPVLALANVVDSIPEDVAVTAPRKLANIVVTESDGGQGTNTLSLSGASAAKFELIGTQLFAKAGEVFPISGAPYVVVVNSDDATIPGSPDASVSFSLASSGPNVAPVATGAFAYTVNDDISIGTVIGDFTATDSDPNAVITTTLANNASNSFEVVQVMGTNLWRLQTIANLDATQISSHTIVLRFFDQYDLFREYPITITVNQALQISAATTYGVSEAVADGFEIATITATGGTPGYTWTKLGGSSLFSISAAGVFTVVDSSSFTDGQIYQVFVRVTDAAGARRTRTLLVSIGPDLSISLLPQSLSILENSPIGASVGTVATDSGIQPFTFTEVAGGNHGGMFQINNLGTIAIADNTNLDYESTAPSHQLTFRVRVTDSATPPTTDELTYTVSILDVNEAPVVASGTTGTVPTGAAAGTEIATATATDPEDGSPATGGTWSITAFSGANNQADYNLNPTTGALTVANGASLVVGTDTITVRYTDSNPTSPLDDTDTITVTVSAPNLPPTATTPQNFGIADGSTAGAIAGSVSGMDPELSSLSFSFPSAVPDWDINPTTGALTVATGVTISQATTPTYSFSVDISDGVNTTTITANIAVTAAGPTVSLSQTSSSGANPGFSVLTLATVTASPPPPTGTLTIVNYAGPGAAGNFSVNNVSGTQLLRTAFYNFPPVGIHTFQVQNNDGTSTGLSQTYTFTAT